MMLSRNSHSSKHLKSILVAFCVVLLFSATSPLILPSATALASTSPAFSLALWYQAGSSVRYDNDKIVVTTKGKKHTVATDDPKRMDPAIASTGALVSPDGTKLIYTTATNRLWHDTQITIVDLTTSKKHTLAQFPDHFWPLLRWSPDSKQIAYVLVNSSGTAPEIYVESIDGTHQKKVVSDSTFTFQSLEGNEFTSFGWDKTGSYVLYYDSALAPHKLYAVSLTTGKQISQPASGASLSSDTVSALAANEPNTPCLAPKYQQYNYSDVMQSAGQTIHDSGCALTSFTMLADYYGADYTPPTMNTCMSINADPFGWDYAATNCSKGTTAFDFHGDFSWDRLNSELQAGHPTIVGLCWGSDCPNTWTNTHYVLVVAGDNSNNPANYVINDPENSTRQLLSLYSNQAMLAWMDTYHPTSGSNWPQCLTTTSTPSPAAPTLTSPTNGSQFTIGKPVSLQWSTTGTQSDVKVTNPDGSVTDSGWQTATSYTFTPQQVGSYTWNVTAQNGGGQSPVSATGSFITWPFDKKPTVLMGSNGLPEVIAMDLNNNVWQTYSRADGAPIAWSHVGNATSKSSPTAYGKLVFARDPNGQIEEGFLNGTSYSWWDISTTLPTGASSSPAVIAATESDASSNYPDVFAIGGDKQIYHTYVTTQTGNWTPWSQIGTSATPLIGTPLLYNDQRFYIRDTSGQIEQAYFANSTWNWNVIGNTTLPGTASSMAALAIPNGGMDPNFNSSYPDVYAFGGDGNLYHTYVSTTTGWWTNWLPIKNMPAVQGDPETVNAGTIYVRDANGQIEEGYGGSDGNWSWGPIGGTLPAGGISSPSLLMANTTVDPNYSSSYPDVFAIGGDGQVYHSYVTTATSPVSWVSWIPVGNATPAFGGFPRTAPATLSTTRPVANLTSQNTLNVFTRGTDNYIWESSTQSDGTTIWTRVGNATAKSSPAVFGNLVFARDPNGQIEEGFLNGTSYSWWDISTTLPTGASSAPAVITANALNAPNFNSSYPDVFAIAGDKKLYHTYVDNTTGNWVPWIVVGSPSTTLIGTPVLYSDLRLYMRDTNGQIEQAYYASGAWNWNIAGNNSLPGTATTTPTLAAANNGVDPNFDSGYPDIYAYGGDGKLYHSYVTLSPNWWTNWSPVQNMPVIQGSPAAIKAGHIYVRDTNGQIEQGYGGSDGKWSWGTIGGTLPAGGVSDPVLLTANTTIDPNYDSNYPDIYVIGGDGQVYHSYVSTSTGTWTTWALVGNVSLSFN
jgi:hypothetical protein